MMHEWRESDVHLRLAICNDNHDKASLFWAGADTVVMFCLTALTPLLRKAPTTFASLEAITSFSSDPKIPKEAYAEVALDKRCFDQVSAAGVSIGSTDTAK